MVRTLLSKRAVLVAVAVTISGATVTGVIAAGRAPASRAQLTAAQGRALTPHAGTNHRFMRRHRVLRALVEATATETGMPVATVTADLRSGQTLDHIAGSKAAAVKNDVLTQIRARLQKAVAAGRITTAQQTTLFTRATARIDTLMNANLTRHGALHPGSTSGSGATTPA